MVDWLTMSQPCEPAASAGPARRAGTTPAPRGPTRRLLWGGAVVAANLLAALAVTWPLIRRVASAIPLGAEHEGTVPLFSLWTLWWTADRAVHGFRGYWDAPFFHPHLGVLTFSEPQILTGLLVAPLWTLGGPPALAYNVAVVAILVLNGVFMYRLLRAGYTPRLAALVAGSLAVSMPFVAVNLGVLPIMPVFGMAWTLEGLVRFARSGAARHAAWAGVGFLALYLSSQQLGLLFAPFALGAGVLALVERQGEGRAMACAGLAVLGVAIIVFAVSAPAMKTHARLGFQRPERLVQALSARPRDFLTRPATALLAVPPRAEASMGDTGGLFPGFLALALGGAAIVAGARTDGPSRRWALYLAGVVVAAGVLAVGLNVSVAGWRPFALFRLLVPGFDRLRSPFRFAAIAQLALVALGGAGLARFAERLPRRARGVAIVGLGLLAVAENLSVPGALLAVPLTPRTAWTAWLREQPAGTVIAHIPVAMGLHVADYEPEVWRLFHQMDHGLPMMNGYSSYFPPGYGRFQFDVNRYFPTRPLLCFMSQPGLGINMLVVDRSWLARPHPPLDAPDVRSLLVRLYADADVEIYRVSTRPEGCGATPAP